MKNLTMLFAIFTVVLISCVQKPKSVLLTCSTKKEAWIKTELKTATKANAAIIRVYPDRSEQVIDGFGACFHVQAAGSRPPILIH